MKNPTDKEKIEMYENFLHAINMYCTCCAHEKIGKLVQNADMWSYAHRMGNGELLEEEQNELIASKFWRLLEVE